MQGFIEQFNAILSGPVTVLCIVGAGIVLSFKTNFVQVRQLKTAFKQIFASFRKREKTNGITPFQAVATALAGTIGTGNIVGVATAIAVGGAGALFWMWVGAFFGMATKYSEITLAIKYRDGYVGGAMYYLNQAFKTKIPAGLFAILCIMSSFGIGNMVQSNAIAGAVRSITPIDFRIIIVGIAILVCFVIIGGIKRIGKVCESLIPFMALFYMSGCVIIIAMNLNAVGGAFAEIMSDAFCFKAAGGGAVGFLLNRAMRIGFARGVFTNEAGLGSAPIAHAAAEVKSAADQGLMGVFEVFFDTIIMCTMTGLVVIISGQHRNPLIDGASITMSAFTQYLGKYAGIFIAISTIFFAVSSIISWSYYGESSIRYLAGDRAKPYILVYKLIFICMVYVGAVAAIDVVWGIADLLNGMMLLPNLCGVLLLSNEVKAETKRRFAQKNMVS